MQKIIYILVSIVFLISFIGVNINNHYSHGKLYSTAIFQEAESCCVNMEHCEMIDTPKSFGHYQENDCSCEDKTESIKISDVFVNEKFLFPTEKTIDLYFTSVFQTLKTTTFFTSYSNTNFNPSPPLIKKDIQSEIGVFLI
jgi:hypothetical protein